MVQNFQFALTRDVSNISDCYFYHVMDLPGYGLVGEEWDLRGEEEVYLGRVPLQGKRVLELGTASGYLCRFMESKGAEVIGFDLSEDRSWDLVPFAGLDMSNFKINMKKHIERLKNGWWLAHKLFHSRAKVVYGNIYDIPEQIGPVDIATFGAILLHLRDPFQALESALRLTRELVIVTEVHPNQPEGSSLGSIVHNRTLSGLSGNLRKFLVKSKILAQPDGDGHSGKMYFIPNPGTTDPDAAVTWWCFPPEVICRFLGILGFGKFEIEDHYQIFKGKRTRLYTVVARRTQKQ